MRQGRAVCFSGFCSSLGIGRQPGNFALSPPRTLPPLAPKPKICYTTMSLPQRGEMVKRRESLRRGQSRDKNDRRSHCQTAGILCDPAVSGLLFNSCIIPPMPSSSATCWATARWQPLPAPAHSSFCWWGSSAVFRWARAWWFPGFRFP